MNYFVRPVMKEDLEGLLELAHQFNLLNLPKDKRLIQKKIDTSLKSFANELPFEQCQYFFAGVDLEENKLFGCSQIIAQKGTEESPNYSFQVIKKEKFSPDLSVGFIHQVLRLKIEVDGPTEIGGLVVNRHYRRMPEKLGRLMSLSRFLFMGLCPDRIKEEVLSDMAPPLTEEGRSEFWEALGRRFTGMPYKEADQLSQQNKEFIRSLFPEEDIYLCLLDSKARLVIGQVGEETRPALNMLKNLGFEYIHEVDPFDGGPHLKVKRKDIRVIQEGQVLTLKSGEPSHYQTQCLVAANGAHGFRAGMSPVSIQGRDVQIPESAQKTLQISVGEPLFIYQG